MKTKFTAIALVLASTLIAGTSFAAVSREQVQAGLTREQVKAELAQAILSGDMLADGETGLKLNERYPDSYPAKQGQAGLTRVQVKAELAESLRTGDFIVVGEELMAKCNELHPNMHSAI